MASGSSKNPRRGADANGSTSGELRSGPVAGTALVSGVAFAQKGLLYANVDGLAMFEGDIVLGTVDSVRATADANAGVLPQFSVGITGQQFRWPNATVPYDIDPALPNQQRVTDAIAHWEANTRIRFVLRTAANAGQFPDFAHFEPGGGCSSMVGRQGGSQSITLGTNCTTGNAIHEIGHTVGLWHEQSREDRDSFVRIVWANIDPAMQHNFSQHISDGDDLGAYDYGSIMHYPANAFSINGQATIVALQSLPAGVTMGQRSGLSQGDIDGVNQMYPPPITIKEIAKDPIRDTLKEINKDPIRDTIKEINKDPIQDTLKEAGKDPIQDTLKEINKDPIQDTIKEAGKDPIQDTLKEINKDPIQDTLKEAGKDPIQDTLKEAGRDPGGTLVENVTLPGQIGGFGVTPGASPFIMAIPSRLAGGNQAADANAQMQQLAEVAGQVQQLAEALVALDQQRAEIQAAYEAAVQLLQALQQGQG